MADETTNDSLNEDRTQAAPSVDFRSETNFTIHPGDEPLPAAERLRAFEDEHIGADAVRINDKIERGSGSPFADLSPELKEQYAALERLVVSEQKLADAHAALIQADKDHDAALAAADPKPEPKPDAGE